MAQNHVLGCWGIYLRTMNRKIIYALLIIPVVFGIIFMATIVEEAFHVMHGKGAKSVCIDFNLKGNDSVQEGYLAAHTVFDPTKWNGVEEFYTWREYSEKLAFHITNILMILLSIAVGVLGNELKHNT